jgi:hypothetical protein
MKLEETMKSGSQPASPAMTATGNPQPVAGIAKPKAKGAMNKEEASERPIEDLSVLIEGEKTEAKKSAVKKEKKNKNQKNNTT